MNIVIVTDAEGIDHEFKVGKATAAQVAAVASIVSSVLRSVSKSIKASGDEGDQNLAVIAAILVALSEEQLVELAAAVIGADIGFARENFDLVWVTEALAMLVEETNLAKVIQNFTRIASRVQS